MKRCLTTQLIIGTLNTTSGFMRLYNSTAIYFLFYSKEGNYLFYYFYLLISTPKAKVLSSQDQIQFVK